MSQFNPQAPVRRSGGGGLDVYAGLLFAAMLILAAGVFLMVQRNIAHSAVGNQDGGVLNLVE